MGEIDRPNMRNYRRLSSFAVTETARRPPKLKGSSAWCWRGIANSS